MSVFEIKGRSYYFFGRPIRPVGFGFFISLMTLFVLNVANVDDFQGHVLGDLVGGVAVLAAAGMVTGWWFSNPKLYEYSLLLTVGVWIQRCLFIGFTYGWADHAVWLALSWGLIAAGSYIQERADPLVNKKSR